MNLKELDLNLKALASKELKVGFFAGSSYEDGMPVAQVAYLNEFGHGNTPPRPFMRTAIAQNEQKWAKTAQKLATMALSGDDGELNALGSVVEGSIAQSIHDLHSPALSPVTIELRAMKKQNPSLVITAATVGEAARKVNQAGYELPAGVSVKPLIDTGNMLASLTYEVT